MLGHDDNVGPRTRRKSFGRVFVKMRLKITAAAALALAAAAAFAACGPQDGSGPSANSARQNATPATADNAAGPAARATPAATPSDGVRRVTIAESRAMAERGEAVIYDVRDDHSFEANHVKGAKLVPLDEVAARAAEFPKDKLVITYCA